MRPPSLFVFILIGLLAPLGAKLRAATAFELRAGDRVVLLGDTLIEREQYSSWIETMLTARFGDRAVTFRNLGWSADTPAGDSRFGLSLLQAGHEPADEGWKQLVRQIEEARPTVVFLGYGMASSFDGAAELPAFRDSYARLLDTIASVSPGVRFVILDPIAHEALGTPWPDPANHNTNLAAYAAAVAEIARARGATHVPLFALTRDRSGFRLTSNGIHPTEEGYRRLAELIEDHLFGEGSGGRAWRASARTEALRAAVVRKNEWFFHRSRPANMAYIFGFRRHEQGRNAAEVLKFDEHVAAEEARIARLRTLTAGDVPETASPSSVSTPPFTPQPHPQFEVADGFEVTLWAENPLLHKPVQINFDAKGRLWVASSSMYPQIEPGQAPVDRIIILEDTTGAGRADKASVFAEGLLIPTGLEPGDGGVYVAQSTDLLHLVDTDGDGRADERRVLLSGFGTEDTHHNLHTLRWGPDGRLNLSQAVYTRTDTETPHGVVRLKAGGVFRLDPRDQRMEIAYRGLINSWGHQFDAYGRSFLSDGAGGNGVSWGVEGATYRTLAPFRRILETVSPGSYPKFCGLEIIRDTRFPSDWQGDIITADFRANRVVRFKIADQASGFVTRPMPDVLRTTADTFRPIDIRLGPDGALYIADWSNPIIQHGEVDFRDPRRDKVHGRIWRVAPKSGSPAKAVDFTALDNRQLLERVGGPNAYDQERATRVLVERGASAVRSDLDAWAASLAPDNDLGRLRALWLHQAFGSVPAPLADRLVSSRDDAARASAVRALAGSLPLARLQALVGDANPRVRLEAVRALGRLGTAEAAAAALGVLDHEMDNFIDYALWLTINELAQPWVAAVKSGAWSTDGREKQLEFALKSIEPALATDILAQILAQRGLPADGRGPWLELIGRAGGPAELRRLLDLARAGGTDDAIRVRSLRALSEAARLRKARPAGSLDDLVPLLSSGASEVKAAAAGLAGAWKLPAAVPVIAAAAGAEATPAPVRSSAFAALVDIGDPAALETVRGLAANGATPVIRRQAAVALATLDLEAAVAPIVQLLRAITDEAEAQAFWRDLLGVRGVGARLTREMPSAGLSETVARAGLRPAREGNRQPALVSALMERSGLSLSAAELTPAEMRAVALEALEKGDAARGELLYRRPELACVACHAIGGAGGKLGPDLTSIGASAPADYLVDSMLYPNSKIKEGYHSVSISTKSGRELSGMIIRETASEILLRDAANQEISIAAGDVARRTNIGSLMPAGLMDGLVPEERLDLIKFLAMLGKPGDYDAARGGVARYWKFYYVTSLTQHLGVERVVRGDETLEGWIPAYAFVNGTLPAGLQNELAPSRSGQRPRFAATRFDAPRAGSVTLGIEGTPKGLWVNGTPVRLGATVTVQVAAGRNLAVIELDDVNPQDIRLRSDDVTFAVD